MPQDKFLSVATSCHVKGYLRACVKNESLLAFINV